MAIARPRAPYPQLSWWGWGDPAEVPALPDGVKQLLAEALGVTGPGSRPARPEDVALPAGRLTAELVARLAAVVGEENAHADHESRLRHLRGKSTSDLLRLRAGDGSAAPDLVVDPGTHEQVQEVLELCSEQRVAAVPFGGGTSVVGGLQPSPERHSGTVGADFVAIKPVF